MFCTLSVYIHTEVGLIVCNCVNDFELSIGYDTVLYQPHIISKKIRVFSRPHTFFILGEGTLKLQQPLVTRV